jgi:DNA polymerase-4
VRLVWGVGPVTEERLRASGITTIGDLADAEPRWLRQLLGRATGTKIGDLALNVDERPVVRARSAGSVGAQSAFGRTTPTDELVAEVLGHLADRVGSRLRAKDRAGRTITARVRFVPMRSVTRSHTLPAPVSSTLTLVEVATDLVRTARAENPHEREISLLGISVSNLARQPAVQLELPMKPLVDRTRPGSPEGAARWVLDRSMDAVRERFGKAAVAYGSVAFRSGSGVPDEFRELAQRDGD